MPIAVIQYRRIEIIDEHVGGRGAQLGRKTGQHQALPDFASFQFGQGAAATARSHPLANLLRGAQRTAEFLQIIFRKLSRKFLSGAT